MDENGIKFLELLQSSLKRASERDWNKRFTKPDLTAEDVVEDVTSILKSQLENGIGAKSYGVEVVSGLFSLQVVFSSIPPSEDEIVHAIDRSKYDYYTFQALRVLARLEVSLASDSLKTWKNDFLSGLIKEPPLPKGPFLYRDAHRNMLIISQIKQLERAGFAPTRNIQRGPHSDAHASGCDIVAAALSRAGHAISYEAVERIWKKREEQPQAEYIRDLIFEAIIGRVSGAEHSDK